MFEVTVCICGQHPCDITNAHNMIHLQGFFQGVQRDRLCFHKKMYLKFPIIRFLFLKFSFIHYFDLINAFLSENYQSWSKYHLYNFLNIKN